MTDGSTYQGSTTKQRILSLRRKIWILTISPAGISCINHSNQSRRGHFSIMKNEENSDKIDYRVEGIDIDEAGVCRNAVISLICPDPFFKDPG